MGVEFRTIDGIEECLIDFLGLKSRDWEGQDFENDFHLIIPNNRKIMTQEVFNLLEWYYGEKWFTVVETNARGINEVNCDLTIMKNQDAVCYLTMTLLSNELAVVITPVPRPIKTLVK